MTGPRPGPRTRPPWFRQARAAYDAASNLDGGLLDAGRIIGALVDEHGADVIPDVMLAWIDTALHQSGMIAHHGHVHLLQFTDVTSGREGCADDVNPDIAWAGRLMTARLADDRDVFEALMKVGIVEQDPAVWGRRVLTLLSCCAITGTRSKTFRKD